MDKRDWSWIKQHMPLTVELLAEYRAAGEGEHLDECWQRGVLMREAGWFYAREGAIALGTPFDRQASPVQCTWGETDWRRAGHVLMLAPLPGNAECRRLNARERSARQIVDVRERERQRQQREAAHGAH